MKRVFRLDQHAPSDPGSQVEDELQHHLELAVEELVDSGWSEEEARREAGRRFGDIDETRRYCSQMQTRRTRDVRRKRMMSFEELIQDLKYAMRSLRLAPGYSGLVVLTLAFGIAANTLIFSVMNPYLLRPLPFGSPDELQHITVHDPVTGWDMARFSYPQYADWRARSDGFVDIAAYSYGSTNATDREGPEQIMSSTVTSNMFDVLDAPAALGRTFRPEEEGPGSERVAVIAHSLWERRYQGDPATVGRAITLDGVQHTVVGVMPASFNFPFGAVKIWTPTREDATSNRGRNPYQFVGRVAPGWTAPRAHDELSSIHAELSITYPDIDGRMDAVVVKPLREALNFAWDMMAVLFRLLMGAVVFVLLIACANVASLTLARGGARRREVSVRAAMGAGRGRIVRQLLTESALLAAFGGTAGVLATFWLTGFVNPLIPEELFRVGSVSVDTRVLAFSLALTALTPLVFGLWPALAASRVSLTEGLKEGSKGSRSAQASRGRKALVVTQVALAVVLISGAGILLRSFGSVQSLDLGFEPGRIVTTEVVLGAADYPTIDERRAFQERAVSVIGSVPGITHASSVRWLPLNHETVGVQVAPSRLAGAPAEEWSLATVNDVLPGYFEATGIELIAGRDFGSIDGPDGESVVVVSQTLAERFWSDDQALGQSLLVGGPSDSDLARVIGVVEDVQHRDLDPTSAGPQYYRPALQRPASRFFVVGRTDSDPSELVGALRAEMAALAPDLPITVRPYEDVVAENQLQWSIGSGFLSTFGAGALLLASLGIYGLVAYSVSQREKEMGVRLALGASPSEIRNSVVGDGLRLTGVGLAVGLMIVLALGGAAVALAGPQLDTVLYGVSVRDPITLSVVLGLFAMVAAVASIVPALRASSSDPISVLRAE